MLPNKIEHSTLSVHLRRLDDIRVAIYNTLEHWKDFILLRVYVCERVSETLKQVSDKLRLLCNAWVRIGVAEQTVSRHTEFATRVDVLPNTRTELKYVLIDLKTTFTLLHSVDLIDRYVHTRKCSCCLKRKFSLTKQFRDRTRVPANMWDNCVTIFYKGNPLANLT